ncbi:MAG: maleylpyruvate isomerase N-terminal domain-containing protein [Flavihumibacter sp.]|nr:maleylpyruvate isomerase N-terminal domain-containing protein [Flavihumibacter sp.]
MIKPNKIEVLPLFEILDSRLLELLKSLTPDEWMAPTVAKLWTVKDIAAHLLDGSLRGLSISRDGYLGEPAENINSNQELVTYLNKLNSNWVTATRRLSPQVLMELLEIASRQYTRHLQQLNPEAEAVFAVAWAGQEVSANWFHIAREYTEKFLHQQQIRDAVNKPGIMTRQLYYPFLNTFMQALPYTFKDVMAAAGTTVLLTVTTAVGGQWRITKTNEGWKLNNNTLATADASVSIDPDTAWKLFSKSLTPEQVLHRVEITGNQVLGKHVLKLVAVMA